MSIKEKTEKKLTEVEANGLPHIKAGIRVYELTDSKCEQFFALYDKMIQAEKKLKIAPLDPELKEKVAFLFALQNERLSKQVAFCKAAKHHELQLKP